MAVKRRRPRGTIDELPSGRFRARVYAGTDPLTKKRRDLSEITETYDQAQVALTRLQNQVDERRRPRSNVTVSQVIEQWLEVAQLENSTRDDYDDLIRLYIAPTFGSTQAAKLDAELLERFYTRLQRCSKLCRSKKPRGHVCTPLSAARVRKLHFVFRAALDKAVRWRYLNVNEATIAQPPSFERSEPDPPTATEAARLLNEAATDPQWCLLLWLTMITGARRGEICHRAGRTSTWMRASSRSSAATRRPVVAPAKRAPRPARNAASQSTATRSPFCPATGRRATTTARRAASRCPTTPSSSPPRRTAPLPRCRAGTQRYRRHAKRLNLRSTRLHALRHYSATELLSNGVDLRTVAGRLGHVDGGVTTLNTYAAWVNEADRRAAEAIGNLVPRPDPSQRQPHRPYEKIAADLRAQIASGALAPGDELPTLAELAVTHDVSVGTAQHAMALLRTEGVIEIARGRRATIKRRV